MVVSAKLARRRRKKMEIEMGMDGYYAIPDIENDFRHSKARREYGKSLQKVQKKLRRVNNSTATKRVLAEMRSTITCENCESTKMIGWGSYQHKVRTYLSKKVRMEKIQRFKCKKCGKTKSILPGFLTHLRRFSNKGLRDMMDAKLWLMSGYRKIAKWGRIGGCSHTHLIREMKKLGPICSKVLKATELPFSGIVCVDKVWFRRVKGIFLYSATAVDARTGRVIFEETYHVNTVKAKEKFGDLQGENIVATKTECIKLFLKDLIEIIDPRVVITDHNSSYDKIIKKIFPRAKHMLCTFHLEWDITKKCKVPRGFKRNAEFEAIKKELLDIFDSDTLKEAEKKLEEVLKKSKDFIGTKLETVFNTLKENKERLFPFLRYGINRTNNPVEHYFSFVKRFQHVSHKFSSLEGLRALLSVFALFYNFAPKMEGPNKGRTPFMKSGWNHKMDMWTYIDYPRCLDRKRRCGV